MMALLLTLTLVALAMLAGPLLLRQLDEDRQGLEPAVTMRQDGSNLARGGAGWPVKRVASDEGMPATGHPSGPVLTGRVVL